MRFGTIVAVVAIAWVAAARVTWADTNAATPSLPAYQRSFPLPGVEGRIDHLAVDGTGQRLFVAAIGNDSLEVVDLEAGKVAARIPGLGSPQGVAVATEAGRLAVSSDADGSVRLYDATSLGPAGTVSLGDDADNVRYEPEARRFWVGYGDGGLAAIDAATKKKVAQVKLAGHPESFQLESHGRRIFVNVPGAEQVAVVDRDRAAVVATWAMKGAAANFAMALDEPDHRLFVACRRPAKLLVFDTESGSPVAESDIVGDADDVFVDARMKRIYVTGGEGFITVLSSDDPSHYRVLGRVPTAPGARTSLFVPESGVLYVAVPHHGEQPAEIRYYATVLPPE